MDPMDKVSQGMSAGALAFLENLVGGLDRISDMSGWGDYGGFSPPTGELSYMSRSWSEQTRFVKAIINLRKDDSIRKMIDIILEDGLEFICGYSKLPSAAQEKILQELTNMLINKTTHGAIEFATKWQLKQMLVDMITGVVISQAMVTVKTYEKKKSPRLKIMLAVTAIQAEGIIEKAAMASRMLKIKDPVLWQKLYNQNYDMLYFLIEKPLKDFMDVKYKTAKRGVQEMGCDQQLELYKDALNNM